jgi:hypothetical protein
MQVERSSNREWQTGEEHVGIYLKVRNNVGKLTLIPHVPEREKIYRLKMSPRLIS